MLSLCAVSMTSVSRRATALITDRVIRSLCVLAGLLSVATPEPPAATAPRVLMVEASSLPVCRVRLLTLIPAWDTQNELLSLQAGTSIEEITPPPQPLRTATKTLSPRELSTLSYCRAWPSLPRLLT